MDKFTIGNVVGLINTINDEMADLNDALLDIDDGVGIKGGISIRILEDEIRKRREYLDQILAMEIPWLEYEDKKKLNSIYNIYYPVEEDE